jgi:hypothetical protein
MSFDPVWLFLSLFPGGIGLVLFVYGRKQDRWPQLLAGLGFMAYPYFTTTIGALTASGWFSAPPVAGRATWVVASKRIERNDRSRRPLSPRRLRATAPVPHDQVGWRWLSAKLTQPGGILPAMIVAVHRALQERFLYFELERRLLEPWNFDPLVQAARGRSLQEAEHLSVIGPGICLERGRIGKILRLGHHKGVVSIAGDP